MVTGTINADGYGFGWYSDLNDRPGTYHRTTPIWSDPDLPRIGRVIASGCMFAAVRNATPGFAVDLLNVPPYVHDHLLFMHNGAIEGFNHRFRNTLLKRISEEIQATTLGSADSEVLFGLALTHLQRAGAMSYSGAEALKDALDHTLRMVMEIAGPEKARASLNMGLTDGRAMVFARTARGIAPNSLYLRPEEHAVWVASEPLDEEDSWQAVPPDSWVMIESSSAVEISPIPDLPPDCHWK
jgi:glutamine amidotransferase